MITSFAHVSLRVAHLEASKNFYMNTLGLSHQRDVENERLKFSFLMAGTTQLELLESKVDENEKRNTGPVDHLAFMVDNLEAEIIRLTALGVHFTMEGPKDVLEFRIIFLEGPDGERIELMQNR